MSLGKVLGKIAELRAQEPSAWGNHDNPLSSKHQAPSHCKNSGTMIPTHTFQRGKEGRERSRQAHSKRQECTGESADLKIRAVKPRDPLQTPTNAHVHNRGGR